MTESQRRLQLGVSALLIVAGMLIIILHGDSSGVTPRVVRRPSIGGHGLTAISLAGLTGPIAVGEGGVWLARRDGTTSSLIEVDPASNAVAATIAFTTGPTAVAAGQGSVWALGSTPAPSPSTPGPAGGIALVRIGPKARSVLATAALSGTPGSLAVGLGSVWVGDVAARTVTQFDRQTLQVVATVTLPAGPTRLAAGLGAVWAGLSDGSVVKIDPSTHTPVAVIRGVKLLALGRSVAWVETATAVERLDPATNRAIGPAYHLPTAPACIATSNRIVWLSAWFPIPGSPSPQPTGPQALVFESLRIDPANLTALSHPVTIDYAPTCPAAGFGALWVPSSAGKALLRLSLTGAVTPTTSPPTS